MKIRDTSKKLNMLRQSHNKAVSNATIESQKTNSKRSVGLRN